MNSKTKENCFYIFILPEKMILAITCICLTFNWNKSFVSSRLIEKGFNL
ncbi:hypothetical protein EV06_1337 [Prochlorococcus sp. MIT 0602]|nr:hypothetical protein EV06_1337 [Prochlorococcus sp. MIT 0602]KGG17745.1 hypothetical protein EV07_1185 [Prochlorococcus sp. MIT 0603]